MVSLTGLVEPESSLSCFKDHKRKNRLVGIPLKCPLKSYCRCHELYRKYPVAVYWYKQRGISSTRCIANNPNWCSWRQTMLQATCCWILDVFTLSSKVMSSPRFCLKTVAKFPWEETKIMYKTGSTTSCLPLETEWPCNFPLILFRAFRENRRSVEFHSLWPSLTTIAWFSVDPGSRRPRRPWLSLN